MPETCYCFLNGGVGAYEVDVKARYPFVYGNGEWVDFDDSDVCCCIYQHGKNKVRGMKEGEGKYGYR